MFLRNVLLAVGAVFLIAGVGLMIVWFSSARNNPPGVVATPVEIHQAVLAAARAIPTGTLLRKEDVTWKDISPGEIHPGNLLHGQVAETEFLGAISRRDFAEGEPLIASDFVKPGDRQFLAAVLKPGYRAVSISVDAPQSVSGLAFPGDYVDVLLTQAFDEKVTKTQTTTYQGVSQTTSEERPMAPLGRKVAGETVLRGVRVIAIDQSLKPPSTESSTLSTVTTEARIPRTVTLELLERQAEVLLVAAKLGSFQLAVRPLEAAGASRPDDKHNPKPVWASDVSQAIREIPPPPPEPQNCDPKSSFTGSTLECSVRRPLDLSYYRAPLASTIIAPSYVERGP
jgi:pilus assembly protein CpaB